MQISKEIRAYKDGIYAAHRIRKYSRFKTIPECPYKKDTIEYMAWRDGFGDATEDHIILKNL